MTSSTIQHSDRHVIGDVWGGLAAMLVALPSAIAFGVTIYAALGTSLSGQGAVAGLLGASVLGLIAPSLGSSPRLISAPSAPAAAMLSAVALDFSASGLPADMTLLLLGLIGLLCGGMQVLLGVVGVGRLIKFIPFPVVSGYLSGVGLIILGSQIPKFLGSPAGTPLLAALQHPFEWAWQSILIGSVVMAAMILTPRLTRAVPPAIVSLSIGVAVYFGLGALDPNLMSVSHNPLVVGPIITSSGSLHDLMIARVHAFRHLGPDALSHVLLSALTLAALLSIDTLKTCVVLDTMTNGDHNPNRELIGQGIANIMSSLIGGIPGSGAMGASVVNYTSGGNTRLSGVMTGMFCFATYLLLSPLISWVPVSALAAILMVVGIRMIDRDSLTFFFSPSTRLDFAVIVSVILVALFGTLIAASGVGVALSIILFIHEQTRSSIIHNRIEGGDILNKRIVGKGSIEIPEEAVSDVVIFELQGSLFFGTASQLHDALEPEASVRKYIILSMRRVQSLDVTATHVLEQIKDQLEKRGGSLIFCDIPKGLPSGLKMKRFLKETGVLHPSDKALAFHQLDDALEWIDDNKNIATDGAVDATMLSVAQMPCLANQPPRSLAALESILEQRSIEAGSRVYKAGADCDELFLIRRGTVRITLPIRKKDNYHLATAVPGDVIGGLGFLHAQGYTSDAVAVTDVDVYVLHRAKFDHLADHHRQLAFAVIDTVAHDLAARLHATVAELQALRG